MLDGNSGAAVDFLGDLKQLGIPSAIVKPVDAVKLVAAPHFLPVMRQQLVVRQAEMILEILGHQTNHARVVRMFIIGFQAMHHDHVGPKVTGAIVQKGIVRTKITIGPLVVEHCVDPSLAFGDHLRIFEKVGQLQLPCQTA